MNDTEPRTERSGDQSCTSGGSDQGEMIQMKRMNAGARALADHEVHTKIFHRGIENFFDGGLQAVNFVEKKYFAQFQRSQNRGQVTFALEQRPGARLDRNVE